MESAEEQNLTALLEAVENQDVALTIRIWRGMTSLEQEAVALTLLRRLEGRTERSAELGPDARDDEEFGLHQTGEDSSVQADETELIPKSPTGEDSSVQADETELIPKALEDLRGLSASDSDAGNAPVAQPVWTGSTVYWSRWRQRWKWSALVTVWAMATIFAFNGAFDAFGPSEWVVGILASVVGSGLLIGTLANFAVALIPQPAPPSRPGP